MSATCSHELFCGSYCQKSDVFDVLFKSYPVPDRKSTRLNSSHLVISYAVFCLKKKINQSTTTYDARDLTHPTQLHANHALHHLTNPPQAFTPALPTTVRTELRCWHFDHHLFSH